MNQEITDKIYCLLTFGGIEIWLDENQKEKVLQAINKGSKVVIIDNRFFTTSSIDGVYKAEDIENMRKHKRGMWECKYENWHTKQERCECGRQH